MGCATRAVGCGIDHAEPVCRYLRIRLSGLEARVLPRKTALEEISVLLLAAFEPRRGHLHLPPLPVAPTPRDRGQRNAPRLRFPPETPHPHHAHLPPYNLG